MYIPVAVVVGLLQATDSYLLFKSEGKPNRFNYFMSTTEFMWVIISAVYLFTSGAIGAAFLSPILFISYSATSFIVGTMMMRHLGDTENITDISIPIQFIKLGFLFGILYALFNVLILFEVIT